MPPLAWTEVDRQQILLDDALSSPIPSMSPWGSSELLPQDQGCHWSGLPDEAEPPEAMAHTLSALGVRSELDRAELIDLAELAELAELAGQVEDEEGVKQGMAQAIMNMGMPGLEDLGDEEAVEQGMAQVMMNMEMEYLPRATSGLPNQEMATSSGRFPPPGPLMPQAIEMNVARTPTLNLQEKFETLVMVNYTPRSPTELPMAQWASCNSAAVRTWDPLTCRSADPSPLLLCQIRS